MVYRATPVRRLVLFHGWGVGGSRHGVQALAKELRALGHDVITPSYGRVWLPVQTRRTSRRVALNWSGRIRHGDVLIGHSNGGRIAWEMSHYTNGRVKQMVLINPALEPDSVPGSGVDKCYVIHHPDDRVVKFARFVPWSDWGVMGATGYQPSTDWGEDSRMVNIRFGSGDHSAFASPGWCKQYADLIHHLLTATALRT